MKRIWASIFLSLCALPIGANADVVWSGVREQWLLPFSSWNLDINADGTSDFLFNSPDVEYRIDPLDGNSGLSIFGTTYDPLVAGVSVGPNMGGEYAWLDDEKVLLDFAGPESGPIVGFGPFYDTNAYLGVSFQIGDATHYGWIHLSHEMEAPPEISLHLMIQDWAWESEADTAIIAGAIPEPSTGILTMVGTLSLLVVARTRRRKKESLPSIPRHCPQLTNNPKKW